VGIETCQKSFSYQFLNLTSLELPGQVFPEVSVKKKTEIGGFSFGILGGNLWKILK
jgi:hypothetical protein